MELQMNFKSALAVSLMFFLATHPAAPLKPWSTQDEETRVGTLVFEKAGLQNKDVFCIVIAGKNDHGDITKQGTPLIGSFPPLGAAHIIVNAAKDSLLGGAGVDGAVHKAAGADLKKWISQNIPCIRSEIRCEIGQAHASPAFGLVKQGVQNIIHTVGPQDTTLNRAVLLRDAYKNSLELGRTLASQNPTLKCIAFPSISTGIYGYPLQEASEIAIQTIASMIEEGDFPFDQVRIVLWPDNFQTYHDAAQAFCTTKNNLQLNGNALWYRATVHIEYGK